MIDAGVLFSLPTESIAIRVVIASVVAALLGRLLLRSGLRVPRIRALAALLPAGALLIVVGMFWGAFRIPAVMMPVDAVDALPVPVRNTYLHFAPIAAPLLAAAWAAVAAVRIGLRLRAVQRTCDHARAAFDVQGAVNGRLRTMTHRVAAEMRVTAPPVALVDRCPGGATVVGFRHPMLVVDRDLIRTLDDEELRGVLAHELAHIRRRDNLVSFAVGVVRDLAFFVPGGRWSLRLLHAERELAADQLAVGVTGKPAALASGLLKVVEGGHRHAACASLMPQGTLVSRVQRLIDDAPPGGPLRSGAELLAVAVALTLAVTAAAEVPPMIAASGERDALAVLVPTVTEPVPAAAGDDESRVFDVYREARHLDAGPAGGSTTLARDPDDDPDEVRPSTLRACAAGASCGTTPDRAGLGIQPRPRLRMPDEALVDRWRAQPVMSTEDGIGLYWLRRLH